MHHAHVSQYGTDLGVATRAYYHLTLWQLGYPDQALQESHRSITLAQDLAHPYSLSYALSVSARLSYLRREAPAAQEQIEAAIRVATEHEVPFWVVWGKMLRGWALALQGEEEEGIAELRQNTAALRSLGHELGVTLYLAMLVDAYRAGGQPEEGLQVVGEALEMVEERGERAYEAELYRLKGELLLQSQSYVGAEAEAVFQHALDVTRRQEAKSWELRTATSLARLWQRQGKQMAALDLLAPVYNWFTEGFDTADLKDAKALLDELA
jgi:predicted ATPase